MAPLPGEPTTMLPLVTKVGVALTSVDRSRADAREQIVRSRLTQDAVVTEVELRRGV